MKILNNMYKFTNTDADVSNSLVYKVMKVAENGDYNEFKKLYKELLKSSYNSSLEKGIYKLMGYEFDFTPFLKRFLVKYKYNEYYNVVYAINKTNIFDNVYISKSQVVDVLEDVRHVPVKKGLEEELEKLKNLI